MEIPPIHLHGEPYPQFKIDLIVWKYNLEQITVDSSIKFKIDLIVWKLDGIMVDQNLI